MAPEEKVGKTAKEVELAKRAEEEKIHEKWRLIEEAEAKRKEDEW